MIPQNNMKYIEHCENCFFTLYMSAVMQELIIACFRVCTLHLHFTAAAVSITNELTTTTITPPLPHSIFV